MLEFFVDFHSLLLFLPISTRVERVQSVLMYRCHLFLAWNLFLVYQCHVLPSRGILCEELLG